MFAAIKRIEFKYWESFKEKQLLSTGSGKAQWNSYLQWASKINYNLGFQKDQGREERK